jgi:hypothetical protein
MFPAKEAREGCVGYFLGDQSPTAVGSYFLAAPPLDCHLSAKMVFHAF